MPYTTQLEETALQQKRAVQKRFLESVALIQFILLMVGLPMSLIRISSTGFHPIHALHVGMSLPITYAFFVRKSWSIERLGTTSVLLFLILSYASFMQYGLVSSGFYFSATAIYISTVAFGRWGGVVISSITMFMLVTFSILWINGIRVFPIDADVYIAQPTVWAVHVVAFLIITGIFFSSAALFQQGYETLVDTIMQQKKEIEHLASHDPLTGLPTRRLALDVLEKFISSAKRHREKLALLYLDLNGFKQVNDTYGHMAGDIVLKAVAERVESALRDEDIISRLGGDEFLAILPKIASSDTVEEIIQRIHSRVLKPIEFNDVRITISISIGAAIYPDDAQTAEALRIKADKEMYAEKNTGRSSFRLTH